MSELGEPMQLTILTNSKPAPVNHQSPVNDKIALFRWLFRGREDVYPRRFESRKTGKSGYAPACANEWVRGVCEKPRIKCAECPHRRFLPVTDDVIRWHLSGQDATGADFVMGVYTIQLPASAVPGWPSDVPLPVDPRWKNDYAASVRRLIRDGVDTPLANLFVHVARNVDAEAEGADRARSATEEFIFRRLETLPETKGRFRLNTQLPIAFDGTGAMEVDLLCTDAKLAIELDGGQHLADANAYRRDRRKDRLLQEHGYFVLRFLAEDVGKRLDDLLDAILRILFHAESLRPK